MSQTPIDISEEGGVRYLHFGSEWVQGAMRIRRPYDLELEYTREMLFGLLLRDGFTAEPAWPKKILLIGLGAGSLAKFCHRHLSQSHTTVVEIDMGVWAVAQQLFKLPPEDRRLQIEIEDGCDFMTRPGPSYDYILIDGYDENARVGLLDSLPFYQACRARLNEGGIVSTNLFGRSRQYRAPLERLAEAFDQQSFSLPQCTSGNVVAFASNTPCAIVSAETLRTRALLLKQACGLDLSPSIERVASAFPDPDALRLL